MKYRVKSNKGSYLYVSWSYGRYGSALPSTHLSDKIEKATVFESLDEASKYKRHYNRTHNNNVQLEIESCT